MSMTCRSKSASSSSSRVARKAVISSSGSWRIKPTVSVMMTSTSLGSLFRLLVGSRVAKRRLSASTELLVSVFRSVDLPAFV